ncbi:hypothetical protein M441DRAFT_281079 [Trichoderma asperellum CBS 433.97]|uniref:Uncharacterized protein n=1 Tax=Trichoderma asperellum (strain ATCC 204424 / CBS 433.97 / NBRC 101777) TaxID=1042311 RepID=A0A2T3YVJ4_TRIA4|nr:hypothetical protein M441DRAFT_281079 [Trichoderma asperellum CBS 433.97]PTB36547.1 hypothetical protein M441DRAFT_281079 [Trichoderma asperellum CBS 433.97]
MLTKAHYSMANRSTPYRVQSQPLMFRNGRRPRELLTRPFCFPWDSLMEPDPCYSPTSPSVPRLGKTRFTPVPVSLKLCCGASAPCSSAGFRSGCPWNVRNMDEWRFEPAALSY